MMVVAASDFDEALIDMMVDGAGLDDSEDESEDMMDDSGITADSAIPIADILMQDDPPLVVNQAEENVTSGIAAIESAARRFNISESEFLSLTSIDPSVLRDLPQDMHGEIVAEYVSQLAPDVLNRLRGRSPGDVATSPPDNATFLSTITQPEIRNEILLTADEDFLASLPPDLHAEAVMLRERMSSRQREIPRARPSGGLNRRPRPPPPGAALQAALVGGSVNNGMNNAIRSITDLFNRALNDEAGQVTVHPMGSNMATVNLTAPADSVGVQQILNMITGATGGGMRMGGRMTLGQQANENNPENSSMDHYIPRLSTAAVNRVCKFYNDHLELSPLAETDVNRILRLLYLKNLPKNTRIIIENLLFNMALSRPLRERIVNELIDRIVKTTSDMSLLPCSNSRIIIQRRLVSILSFLVNQIPSVMKFVSLSHSRINELIFGLSKISDAPIVWELLHHLLVPVASSGRPATTRHRVSGHEGSVVDRMIGSLTRESIEAILEMAFGSSLSPKRSNRASEIISSISNHSEDIAEYLNSIFSKFVNDLGDQLAIELSTGRLTERDTTIDELRLCELVRAKRSLTAVKTKGNNAYLLTQLWEALDKAISPFDAIHASEEPISSSAAPSPTSNTPVLGGNAVMMVPPTGGRPATSVHHGIRRLFHLIEAFIIDHDVVESSPAMIRPYVTRPGSVVGGFVGGVARSLSRAVSEMNPQSGTVTDSPRENQLIEFADRHRRPLNGLIRESPELLFGSFSPIVRKCPWILDFDNKRKYFRKKLKQRGDIGKPPIRLSVRRSEVFMDSFYQLRMRSGNEMRGKLSVQFTGEEGVDAGGLVREWFGILAREIFNPNYALFRTAGGKASTFHPNPNSFVNPDHLSFFEFCGRIMGKALYDDQRLDAYFTRSFYKHMLGAPVTWMDFEVEDPEFYKQLMWILDTDLKSSEAKSFVEDLNFTTDVDEFGHIRTVELVPGGSSMSVTEDNKREFVRLVCEYKMTVSITPQVEAFMKGFHELIPSELIGDLFDDKELELLISGLPTINLSDLRANTEYVNYTASSEQIQWFWRVLENDFSQEQLAWFLQFVTGSAQVPLEGFKALMGMRGPQKFSIHKAYGADRLPTAHTCFNQLDLPEYTSEEALREKLLKAVTEAHEGFGFI